MRDTHLHVAVRTAGPLVACRGRGNVSCRRSCMAGNVCATLVTSTPGRGRGGIFSSWRSSHLHVTLGKWDARLDRDRPNLAERVRDGELSSTLQRSKHVPQEADASETTASWFPR